MPLRERLPTRFPPLPTISPSAVPAPKYAGGQRCGPRRPSFWDSESDRYWEQCRQNKRSTRGRAVRLLGFVLAIVVMIAVGLRVGRSADPTVENVMAHANIEGEATGAVGFSDGSNVTPATQGGATTDAVGIPDGWDAARATRHGAARGLQDIPSDTDAKVSPRKGGNKGGRKSGAGEVAKVTHKGTATDRSRLSDGEQLKTLACMGSSVKHDLESKTCANACARARTTAPRPLAHRSCLAGCRAGVTTAWDIACVGGLHRNCVRDSTERCDFLCASYRNQFPKPTIFNQCMRSCLDIVETTCLRSKEVFASA